MFPQFASTARSITRATALITRVGTDASLYDDPETEDFSGLLDSKFEAEKIEGMKRLIALMSQGRDVSNFFPQVVKNVVTQSLELKKLVYIYLVHYAEKRPDEALLAINTFQKDLSDLNPLVRAWALRSMSGIRVRVVLPLVVMAMTKCSRDPSPYVRRCAAHAIPKVYSLDHDQHIEALEELICSLMNDNSPGVIGAVAAAFNVVCPEKLSLWGPRFQKMCELLPDVDEWGQVVIIDILLRYAIGRHGYPKGSIGSSCVGNEGGIQNESKEEKLKGKMEEQLAFQGAQMTAKEDLLPVSSGGRDTGSQITSEFWLVEPTDESIVSTPSDIEVFLQRTFPLLGSHNSAVVMAAAGAHWLLASMANLKKIAKPVIFLLQSSFESQYVVLANIATFVRQAPSLFEPYYEEFFISSQDGGQIRALKLDILCLLATESSIQSILEEFQEYVGDPDRQFAAKAVRAIGLCALRLPSIAKVCTKALVAMARSGLSPSPSSVPEVVEEEEDDARREKLSRFKKLKKKPAKRDKSTREALVVTEAIMALRVIVHERPVENEEVLVGLARCLDRLKVPAARTVVICMIGEFGSLGTRLPQTVPVILRYLGGTFKKEADETKFQILNCAVKVVLRSDVSSESSASRTNLSILDYVLKLAAVDLSYDIRDRARWYQGLLAFHLQKVSEEGTSVNRMNIGDQLLSLKLEETSTDPDLGTKRFYEGDEEGISNPVLPKMDDGKAGAQDKEAVLLRFAKRVILAPKPAPILPPLAPQRSAFVAGSMSHIVLHRAPNYFPIPAPSSIELLPTLSPPRSREFTRADDDLDSSSNGEFSGTVSDAGKSDRTLSPRSTGSFYDEENGEIRSSQTPLSSSDDERTGRNKSEIHASSSHGRRGQTKQHKRPQEEVGPLINFYDSEGDARSGAQQNEVEQTNGGGLSSEFGLLSAAELESWLGSSEPGIEEQPSSSGMPSGYATVSIGMVDVKPKLYTLLDFTNGGGLDVKYCADGSTPTSSKSILTIKLYFTNRSLETISGIAVTDVDSGDDYHEIGSNAPEDPGTASRVISSEQDVSELEPGGKGEGRLSVFVRGHLDHIKLSIHCNGNTYLVKLTPGIGSLIKPVRLSPEAFSSSEARITGMHEASRRCILIIPPQAGGSFSGDDQILLVAQAVAQRVLTTAHVSLVSTVMPIGDSALGVQAIKSSGLQGLSLQFSGETLVGSVLCLIKVRVLSEGEINRDGAQLEVLVKINCEDTIFGWSLLQELSKALNPLG
ncbi:unnamed protein product [Calypogeia fissa]